MTLPKGYGGGGSGGGKERKSSGGGKGKKVGIGVAVALAAVIAAGAIGASVQPSDDSQSNSQSLLTTQSQTGLSADITVGRDPISRGSVQTVTVTVTDGGKRLSGASIDGVVTYASGSTQKPFGGLTDENGQVSYSWRIGGNSSPGFFQLMCKYPLQDINHYQNQAPSKLFEQDRSAL